MTDDSTALSERAQEARADMRRAVHRLAVLLVQLVDEGHLKHLGYASLKQYASSVLDLSPREARDVYRLGTSFPTMPTLAAAMEAGALDWTKAREILRVSTPDTEAAWVGRALQRTSRELEREVSATPFGAPPPEVGAPILPESQRGRLSLDGERSDIDTIRRAIAVHRARCGLDTEELDDCALLALIALASIRAAEEADVAGSALDETTGGTAPGREAAEDVHSAGDVEADDGFVSGVVDADEDAETSDHGAADDNTAPYTADAAHIHVRRERRQARVVEPRRALWGAPPRGAPGGALDRATTDRRNPHDPPRRSDVHGARADDPRGARCIGVTGPSIGGSTSNPRRL